MTKQKIVVKVTMPGQRSRSHALAVAAKAQGVSSVGITGAGDQLEVVGDGIHIFCLLKCLRKKFCYADIVKVEEVKEEKKKKPDEPKPCPCWTNPPPWQCPAGYYCYAPPPPAVFCEEPTSGCNIM